MSITHVYPSYQQASHASPADFTVAYTSPTTITAAGCPFVIADATCHIIFVQVRPAGGLWSAPLLNGINGVSFTAAANVITAVGMPVPFAAGDEYWVGVRQLTAASSSSGTATGGGTNIYISPQDFTAAYLGVDTLTLTGLPYTPEIEQFLEVVVATAGGEDVHYTPENYAFAYNPGTGVLTVTGAVFLVGDLGYRVVAIGPSKGFTQLTNSNRTQEINPLSSMAIAESLVDTAVLAVGTAYFPSSAGLSLLGYKSILSQIQIGVNAVCTVEASVLGTDWVDVSRACYDMQSGATGVANWANTSATLDLESCEAALIRFKVVVVTAPTPTQIDIRRVAL